MTASPLQRPPHCRALMLPLTQPRESQLPDAIREGLCAADWVIMLRLPLRTAAPYSSVLINNQPKTAIPSRRTSAVNAPTGLVVYSHVPKCGKSTVPRKVPALHRRTKPMTSQTRTPNASR